MLTSFRLPRVTAGAAIALTLALAGTVVAEAAPAHAAVSVSPLEMKIVADPALKKGFVKGSPITFTYTLTNTHSTAVTLSKDQGYAASWVHKWDDPEGKPSTTGPCQMQGFGDFSTFTEQDLDFVLPSSLAAGASLTCTLRYPATSWDVANKGVWTRFYYVASLQNYSMAPGWWWAAYSSSATTSPLTVTGAATIGSPLTAKLGYWGIWHDSYAYQWLRDGVAIAGATASTYRSTTADLGHRLTVKVVGKSNEDGSTVPLTSAATAVVTRGPVASTIPALAGTVRVGVPVSAKPGTWTAGTTFAYQWNLGGKRIPGATGQTYVPAASTAGAALTVTVTGNRAGYASVIKTSAPHTVALGALMGGKPTLAGAARVGSTLVAKPGTWTSGTTLHYQWLASGQRIPGATGSAYKLGTGTVGKRVSVQVSGTRAGYATLAASSAATAPVSR